MKSIPYFLLVLILITNCSSKKRNAITETHDSVLKDSILLNGSSTFKRILRDDGQPIYIKETTDFYSTGDTEKKIIIKSTSTVSETPSWYPQYNLVLESYDIGNTIKPMWKKEIKDESPIGMWDGYIQTVQFGCCSSEDGKSLYDIKTGNKVMMFTGEPKQAYLERAGYIFYQSASATNFKHDKQQKLGGIIFLANEPFDNVKSIKKYTVQYADTTYYQDAQFDHTPEFKVVSKYELHDTGFFRASRLFINGREIQKLDTAKNYLRLIYANKYTIIVPFDDQENLHESELICSNEELSKNFILAKSRQ